MDDATPLKRADHFRPNCLAWAALVHFLPAALLREFCYVAVDLISAGQFTLAELFEEKLLASGDDLDQWEIRPLPVSDPIAQYLQRRVRTFVWGNDSYVTFGESGRPRLLSIPCSSRTRSNLASRTYAHPRTFSNE